MRRSGWDRSADLGDPGLPAGCAGAALRRVETPSLSPGRPGDYRKDDSLRVFKGGLARRADERGLASVLAWAVQVLELAFTERRVAPDGLDAAPRKGAG
jgi:hypothetical protein